MTHRFTRRNLLTTLAISAGSSLLIRPSVRAADTPITSDVLVIGAGAAGLAAARTLHDQGKAVIVLEARNRIGGRVWSDRTWRATSLDLGASWIHGIKKNPLTELARQAGAQTVATDFANIVAYDWQGQALADEMQDELDEALETILEEAAAEGEKLSRDQSLQAALDRLTAEQALTTDEARLFAYILNTTIEQEFAADANQLSLWYYNEGQQFAGDHVVFPNGFDQLFSHLAGGLDVRLGQVVQRIEYGGERVRVITNQGTFLAAKVIITLPLGVLKSGAVVFDPPLPQAKQAAIQRLGMGLLNKTYLRFPSVFWDAENEWIGFAGARTGEWAAWLNLQYYIEKPVLLGFNAGSFGRVIESWSDEKIVANAMQTLQTIYGKGIPKPTGAKITRWASDPFSRGAYSFLAVGATPKDYEIIAEPVRNRLFFAGEHTSRDYAATVHGALLSGRRAAA